ncbi:transporter substrate-binding domain-containing protein [Proteocatella sphenisci]|uniref:transporter substrate-binding domain-containing protein n=1 Tax=Proteocatella sphenisci TaxID=181070 RepID=UPI0004AD7C68|nr:transporter substrate-binding domain-containing protein [Proteocatella sphenisci]
MKKLLSIIITGIMALSLMTGCGSTQATEPENKLEAIKSAGKLIVGTSADYPPYEFHMIIDGVDTIVGFDVEIAKEIAAGLGVELEIKDMAFDAVLAGVGTGMIDLGVAGINPTPEREAAMDFSDVYYKASHTIVVKSENVSQYKSQEDLKGKVIGAQTGTLQEGVAQEIEGVTVKSLGKVTDLILELKTGKIDAVILELPVANSYANQNEDLSAVKEVVFEKMEGGSSVITAEGEKELMAAVNEIIAKLIKEGKIDTFVADATMLAEKLAN